MGEIEGLLARCLEAMERGASIEECLARHPAHGQELEPLLRAAQRVRAAPTVAPSPDFHQGARERMALLIEHRSRSEERPSSTESGGLLERLRARASLAPSLPLKRLAIPALAALTVILLVGVLSVGGAYASSDALPGNPLYGVKLAGERVQLALTFNERAQAELHLRLAAERLEEAEALLQQNRADQIGALMRCYATEMEAASGVLRRRRDRDSQDASLSTLIQEQVTHHHSVLSQVRERVPEAARPAVERALEVSKRAGTGAKDPEDDGSTPPLERPTRAVTTTQPIRTAGSPTPAVEGEPGRPDSAGTMTPPGRTRAPEAPGLTMTRQPPGRTHTPQGQGDDQAPQPPGQTHTPMPPVQTPTPMGPAPGVTPGPPEEPGPPEPPDAPDPPGPPGQPGPPGEEEGPGAPGQGDAPGRP